MTLTELDVAVQAAKESAIECGVSPDNIFVNLQIDGPGTESVWATDVELMYDNYTQASGCVLVGEFSGKDMDEKEDLQPADEYEVEMKLASSVDMRKALEIANVYKTAGILFVPMPVLSDSDGKALCDEVYRRLDVLAKMADIDITKELSQPEEQTPPRPGSSPARHIPST